MASVACDQLCTMDIKAYKVEDLGIPPYWFGSIICNTAGPTYLSTTKSSATLEIAGVKEIGRRCLVASTTGFCFVRGTTSASFQGAGSLCSLKLAFNIDVIGCTRISAYTHIAAVYCCHGNNLIT